MQTIQHPDHGQLTISPTRTPGKRSYTCTRSDGTTVELSSKRINRLLGISTGDLVSYVRSKLNSMPDNGVERLQVAKAIWEMLDKEFLGYQPLSDDNPPNVA